MVIKMLLVMTRRLVLRYRQRFRLLRRDEEEAFLTLPFLLIPRVLPLRAMDKDDRSATDLIWRHGIPLLSWKANVREASRPLLVPVESLWTTQEPLLTAKWREGDADRPL